jgi:hypothetical protein
VEQANGYENPAILSRLAATAFGLLKRAEGAAVGIIKTPIPSGPITIATAGVLSSTGDAVKSVGKGVENVTTSAGAGIKKGFTIVTVVLLAIGALYVWKTYKNFSRGA